MSYKVSKLGDYLEIYSEKNSNLEYKKLYGVTNDKRIIKSIANVIGTDMSKYSVARKNMFVYGPVTSRNGDKISISLYKNEEPGLFSSSYTIFKIKDDKLKELLPEYLMLFFNRSEFDRYARFESFGSVREIFDWNNMCNTEIRIPSMNDQKNVIKLLNKISDFIKLNNHINDNLYEIADLLYKCFIKENNIAKEVKLGDLANIKYGKGLPTSKLEMNGFPVYGGNGIIGYYHEYMYDTSMVLISCRGAASGKVSFSKPYSYITNNSLILECDRKYYYYLKQYSLNNQYYEYTTGSAQPQITIENIRDILILLPNENQLKNFNIIQEKIEEKQFQLQSENDKLSKLRDDLLPKLMNGEIDLENIEI